MPAMTAFSQARSFDAHFDSRRELRIASNKGRKLPSRGQDSDGAERLSEAIDQHLSSGGAVLAASHQSIPGEWPKLGLGA